MTNEQFSKLYWKIRGSGNEPSICLPLFYSWTCDSTLCRVGWSVVWSIRPSHFWIPSGFHITAPAQPSATGLLCTQPCFDYYAAKTVQKTEKGHSILFAYCSCIMTLEKLPECHSFQVHRSWSIILEYFKSFWAIEITSIGTLGLFWTSNLTSGKAAWIVWSDLLWSCMFRLTWSIWLLQSCFLM